MLDGLSHEELLICILSRPLLSEARRNRARSLVSSGIEWELFLDLTLRHNVYPLVSLQMSRSVADLTPEPVVRRLRAASAANARISEAVSDELVRLLALLEEAGIRAVPLKGPVLAERIWGDARLGVYPDLDLLVAPGDLEPAAGLLYQHGYEADWKAGRDRTRRGCRRSLPLVRSHPLGFAFVVDLQDQPIPGRIDRTAGAVGLWSSLEAQPYRKSRTWQPPDDLALVILALDVLGDWFESLRKVAQLYGFMQGRREVLPRASQAAQRMGVGREFQCAIESADALLGDEAVEPGKLSAFSAALAEGPFRPVNGSFMFEFQLAMQRTRRRKLAFLLASPFAQPEAANDDRAWLRYVEPVGHMARLLRKAGARAIGSIWDSVTLRASRRLAAKGHVGNPK